MSIRRIMIPATLGLAIATTNGCASKKSGLTIESTASRGVLLLAADGTPRDSRPIGETFVEYTGGAPYAMIATAETADGAESVWSVGCDGRGEPVADATFTLCGGDTDSRAVDVLLSGSGVWIMGSDTTATADCIAGNDTANAALRTQHARGIITGGSASGAACFGPSFVASGTSAELLGTGAKAHLAPGINLIGNAIIDTEPLGAGNLGRLVAAMAETGAPWGIGLEAGSGAIIDPENQRLTVVDGNTPVVLVDARHADLSPRKYRFENLRISLLSPGDAFSFETGTLKFIAGKTAHDTKTQRGMPPAPDAWAPGVFSEMLRTLAESRVGTVLDARSTDGETTLDVRLTRDESTFLFRALDSQNAPEAVQYTIYQARLDITPNAAP